MFIKIALIILLILLIIVIVKLLANKVSEGCCGFNNAKAAEIGLLEGYYGFARGMPRVSYPLENFNNTKAGEIGLLEGFADRFNEPAGYFATSGGTFMDDVSACGGALSCGDNIPEDDPKRIFGGKGGDNEFTSGCGCALGVTGMKTPYVANNASVLDYKAFGAEPDVMNNSVGKGRAYLSMTDYMPEGTNLFFEGDMYVPPYSYYSPPLF